ncbi:hypothetical protein HDU92_006056 [Lobulomyces angularis]|nr:hypothetical protein HDU92_006056 [Lobulomyces angularis]
MKKCENCRKPCNEILTLDTTKKQLKRCSECKSYYCSKECQKLDWKKHKHICQQLKKQFELDKLQEELLEKENLKFQEELNYFICNKCVFFNKTLIFDKNYILIESDKQKSIKSNQHFDSTFNKNSFFQNFDNFIQEYQTDFFTIASSILNFKHDEAIIILTCDIKEDKFSIINVDFLDKLKLEYDDQKSVTQLEETDSNSKFLYIYFKIPKLHPSDSTCECNFQNLIAFQIPEKFNFEDEKFINNFSGLDLESFSSDLIQNFNNGSLLVFFKDFYKIGFRRGKISYFGMTISNWYWLCFWIYMIFCGYLKTLWVIQSLFFFFGSDGKFFTINSHYLLIGYFQVFWLMLLYYFYDSNYSINLKFITISWFSIVNLIGTYYWSYWILYVCYYCYVVHSYKYEEVNDEKDRAAVKALSNFLIFVVLILTFTYFGYFKVILILFIGILLFFGRVNIGILIGSSFLLWYGYSWYYIPFFAIGIFSLEKVMKVIVDYLERLVSEEK